MKASFFFPFLILLLAINLLIFNQDFYKEEVVNYISHEETITNLLSYFQGQELEETSYSQREVLHLKDVRTLIWASWTFIIIFSLLIIYLLIKNKNYKKELYKGGIYSLITIAIFSFSLLFFTQFFTLFHEILFTNDLWLLPTDSLLIQMFPERFFIQSTKQILLYSLILSLLCIIIGGIIPGENNDKRT